MSDWTWAAARCRGTSHVNDGTRCQDAIASSSTPEGWILAVLSDGAGSAEYGGEGAAIVARTISVRAREYVRLNCSLPDDQTLWQWIDEARDRIILASRARQRHPRDFAATLVTIISNGDATLAVHIGDGGAAAKALADDSWFTLTWPSHGEYAATTYFITDEPTPHTVVSRHNTPVSAIVAFTDGMERLALDFLNGKPHAPYFETITAPVAASPKRCRDQALSARLALHLDSEKVNARTDDDKTLFIAARR